MIKKIITSILMLSMVFAIAACSSGNTGPVAIVNGIEISREDFNAELDYNIAMYQQQGQELTAEELNDLKEFVLDTMINTALLLEAARNAGFDADTVNVDEEIAEIKGQFEDDAEFEAALEAEGLTLEFYREIITEYLMVQSLFEKELDFESIEVSEEEVNEMLEFFWEMYGEQGADLDEDELKAYFTADIRESKIDEMIGKFIDDLRAASNIEKKL